jgi:hypothetical protein
MRHVEIIFAHRPGATYRREADALVEWLRGVRLARRGY